LLNSETVAFQLDSSEQGYFPDPSSLRGGSGNETVSVAGCLCPFSGSSKWNFCRPRNTL